MKLLSTNYKTNKAKGIAVDNYLLPLEPNYKLCPMAKKAGCGKTCIVNSGMNKMPTAKKSKEYKTYLFENDKKEFFNLLINDLDYLVRNRISKGITVAVRLNGYSDILWENIIIKDNKTIFELYPMINFYDYTKIPKRDYKRFSNYHLTFSHTRNIEKLAYNEFERGLNIAKIYKEVPKFDYINGKKVKVIDGDKIDLRYNDDKNVIVGLKFKGSKKDLEIAKENGLI